MGLEGGPSSLNCQAGLDVTCEAGLDVTNNREP